MTDQNPTRKTLLLKLRDPEDTEAWEEFAALYTPLIFQFCLRRGVQNADAADVTQEVMRAVAGAIGRFEYDASRGTFRGWLYTVTRNKLNNFFNRRKKEPQGTGRTTIQTMIEAHSVDVEADWESEYNQRMLHWALEHVKSEFETRTFEAFWRTSIEEEDVTIVCDEMELTPGAIYSAKYRILAKIRKVLESTTGEEDLAALES